MYNKKKVEFLIKYHKFYEYENKDFRRVNVHLVFLRLGSGDSINWREKV